MNPVTVAAAIFGPWLAVTPQTMTVPVPEFVYSVASLGSVGKPRTSQPLPAACALYENGRIVGYSLSCEQARRPAAGLPES